MEAYAFGLLMDSKKLVASNQLVFEGLNVI